MAVFAAAVVAAPSSSKSPAVAELQVSNLTCGACSEKIRQAVQSVDPSAEVQVDVPRGLARVVYDENCTTALQLAEQVSRAGYPSALATAAAVKPGGLPGTPMSCPGAKKVKPGGCGGGCGGCG